ncbi:MAG: Crp/Fnr family transcriptional regulator [Acetobacteraceae bacterium]
MANDVPPMEVRNQLLTALPPELLSRLLPRLRLISLTTRDSLMVPDAPIEAAYFVESGFVSLVTSVEDGTQAEVGLIGREGMVGLPLITGVDTSFVEAFVQGDGSALRMEARVFRAAMEEEPALRTLLLRYLEAMTSQVSQTAACNGRHDLEQRLARWLLMAHDRAGGDEFQITQEFLALMLCVYRPSVSVVASTLQRAGIIRYGRGRITVLDREALEATACDCYRVVKARFERLLGG